MLLTSLLKIILYLFKKSVALNLGLDKSNKMFVSDFDEHKVHLFFSYFDLRFDVGLTFSINE